MAATNISAVWLDLLRAQRPKRLREIVPELGDQRHSALNKAFRLGYIERSGEPRRYFYAVTPRCTVPPGVPVLEILEATA